MKKLTFILLLLPLGLFAQNLIPNGDFELGPDSSSVGWSSSFDSTCTGTYPLNGPNSWVGISSSPDRLVEGTIYDCNWSNDTAQSGKAYVLFGYYEAGKTTLLFPLEKDSIYRLKYFISLQTFNGQYNDSCHCEFRFNNNGNTIIAPYISSEYWQYIDTTFIAESNSTELEIWGIDMVSSGNNIDNISLTKEPVNYIAESERYKTVFDFYPNPSTGIVQIDINESAEIDIYNLLNERVFHKSISSDINIIDLSQLPKGLYFLNLINKQRTVIQKKIIIN